MFPFRVRKNKSFLFPPQLTKGRGGEIGGPVGSLQRRNTPRRLTHPGTSHSWRQTRITGTMRTPKRKGERRATIMREIKTASRVQPRLNSKNSRRKTKLQMRKVKASRQTPVKTGRWRETPWNQATQRKVMERAARSRTSLTTTRPRWRRPSRTARLSRQRWQQLRQRPLGLRKGPKETMRAKVGGHLNAYAVIVNRHCRFKHNGHIVADKVSVKISVFLVN